MDECVGRKRLNSGSALPVAYLVCNFLPPGGERPALLTHDDVLTLFHEFGHGLHHLLTRVTIEHRGYQRSAWDAVELPSQFLENYAWNPDVLCRISCHIETKASLPAETQARLIATRSFHAGLQMMRQLEFALFDFRLHAEYDPAKAPSHGNAAGSPQGSGGRSGSRVESLPEQLRTHLRRRLCCRYYSYKWAEVLAADAFAAFEENGVFDRKTAHRFLDAILTRAAAAMHWKHHRVSRRRPDVRALLKQHGILATGELAA